MQIRRPQQLKHQLILPHTQYDTQMYLSTLQNVFVVIVKCISYQVCRRRSERKMQIRCPQQLKDQLILTAIHLSAHHLILFIHY